MSRAPDFDELVGVDIEPGERERLRRVHALLVEAGPPSELPPELESGPTLAMTLSRRRKTRRVTRRVMLLAAAIAVLTIAFLAGYLAANNGGGIAAAETMSLVGTAAAPSAEASLQLEPVDAAGNWPMRISVTGLPQLPSHSYYEVYLVRNGKPYAPCGTFKVAGTGRATSVELNAPYRLHKNDTWIVTKVSPNTRGPGEVMLTPVA